MGGEPAPVRVSAPDLTVEALHHPPRLAAAPGGLVYLSWSSVKREARGDALRVGPAPVALARTAARPSAGHLRVNEDRPISHSFDGLAVASDGTVLVSWIDGRAGGANAGTYLARVADRGERVDGVVQVGEDTCVCCRVDLATGPGDAVAVLWRKVFPGDVRDMVLGASRDGGRAFAPPAPRPRRRVEDRRVPASRRRGGHRRPRAHLRSWYTEGEQARPDLYFATSADGRRFGPPRRLHTSATSIPDHARMAVDREGRAVIVWEDSTAVRRRVLLRYAPTEGARSGPCTRCRGRQGVGAGHRRGARWRASWSPGTRSSSHSLEDREVQVRPRPRARDERGALG